MPTTFADLEERVKGHGARIQRFEEDMTAIITTLVETREDVARLRRQVTRTDLRVKKILDHLAIADVTEEEIDAALDAES